MASSQHSTTKVHSETTIRRYTPLCNSTIFTILWSISALFQSIATLWLPSNLLNTPSIEGIIELGIVIAAFGVLWKPLFTPPLIILALLQFTAAIILTPSLPNHRLVCGFAGLAIVLAALVSLGSSTAASKQSPFSLKMYCLYAPAMRWGVLILYFFVTFHKANSDFLSVETSCSVVFYKHLLDTIPILPTSPWVLELLPYLTLMIEGTIPILLAFSRTRNLGILSGLSFHFLLAFDTQKHFFDFSSTMFALLILFLPEEFPLRVSNVMYNLQSGMFKQKYSANAFALLKLARVIICFSFLMAIVFGFATVSSIQAATAGFFYTGHFLWQFYGMIIINLFIFATSRNWYDTKMTEGFKLNSLVLVVVPSLMFLNGLGPYLGFKTRSAFDMYSNLRVENGVSNHLLITMPLYLTNYLNDLVSIQDASDQELLKETKESNLKLTYFEFLRYTSQNKDVSITYERNSQLFHVARVGDNHELSEGINPILGKIFMFRPVDMNKTSRCQW